MADLCKQCGVPLPATRKLKTFCSYACRGQFDTLAATTPATGLLGAKNLRRNKELRTGKSQAVRGVAFARVNDCTYRVDAPTKHGAGWLMELAWPGGRRMRWIARVGNRASDPASLEDAKSAAAAMVRTRGDAKPRDWIAELNEIAASEVDRAALATEAPRTGEADLDDAA